MEMNSFVKIKGKARVGVVLLFSLFFIALLWSVSPGWTNLGRRAEINSQLAMAKPMETVGGSQLLSKSDRIVIIGAGPTGLGAAYRLSEQLLNKKLSNEVIILESEQKAGGLASSYRDERGFLWDNGGHVVFSHFPYFDKLLKKAVQDWNVRSRASFAFMQGSSGERKFVPYPVQNNIHVLDKKEQNICLEGLKEIQAHPVESKPQNFDEWLLKNFGEGLSEVFMRKYNRKVWTVDPKEMNSDWVGERVAVPNVDKISEKIEKWNRDKKLEAKDSNWGPNKMFTFPAVGGTGQIWENVSKFVPKDWFRFGHTVTSIDSANKNIVILGSNKESYSLEYDVLISTAPLDDMLSMVKDGDSKLSRMQSLSQKFVYSHTHVIGIGLKGQPPPHLADKSWIYFPDDDSPFYRITVFSNYADDNVPSPGDVWSLMCEAAEPKNAKNLAYWTEDSLIQKTVDALKTYGFINNAEVLSTYHRRLQHGYPVPFLKREQYLSVIQPWLESKSIFSRGRFGGWRYEVSNQDHSLMQGVEVADFILFGTPEETYPNASLVNSMKASNRCVMNKNYEVVVALYDEDLTWLSPFADHCHIYQKGSKKISAKKMDKFWQWDTLPNVGRESHTYLHHIITNYNCLSDVTIFFQGDIKAHLCSWLRRLFGMCSPDISAFIREAQKNGLYAPTTRSKTGWGRIHHIEKWAKMLETGDISRANLTLGEFWDELFGYPHPQEDIIWHFGNVFSVSRSRILSRPKSFYEKAISFVDHHPNPEEGHYFERLFTSIFSEDTVPIE